MIENTPEFPGQNDEIDLHRALVEAQDTLNAWQTCAMQFLDAIQRGIAHYALDDPRAAVLIRDAELFLRAAAPCGFWRIAPAPGDPVAEDEVQVMGVQPSPDYPPYSVLSCTAWGYRAGGAIIKRAEVILVAPATAVNGESS